MSYTRISSSSTEALLAPQQKKDYFSTVAAMQGSIGITGQSPMPPQPKPLSGSDKTHFWSRKDKSQPQLKRQQQQQSQQQQQPKQPSAAQKMSREEALEMLMDKYGMASVQLGGRSGRM
ncbi:hypothetical protein CALCODRAFT_500926 [Calocera cornea HHB12733]|uniref:Uncharacterized protein n=1 Tax=Calocera cornea HHB12733 TaxID=1353952 RepID=A0A165DUN4_9BASI|nr:hypothetical protein CALCODRAFT_500926 [Calocera cornea HHB12733]